MARFDPDFSIFGILAGDLLDGTSIEDTRIDYVNKACTDIYGDLKGVPLGQLFAEIAGSCELGGEYL